jgi:hypothetical protein
LRVRLVVQRLTDRSTREPGLASTDPAETNDLVAGR